MVYGGRSPASKPKQKSSGPNRRTAPGIKYIHTHTHTRVTEVLSKTKQSSVIESILSVVCLRKAELTAIC